jgi:acetolactate synthase-1/3 small subunit
MEKFLQAKADHGVDTLLKVVGVLRRKEFMVSDVKMSSPPNACSHLEIRLENASEFSFDRAMAHLEKIVGIRDVEVMEEN